MNQENNPIVGVFRGADGVERPLHEVSYLEVMNSLGGRKDLTEEEGLMVTKKTIQAIGEIRAGMKDDEEPTQPDNTSIERTIVRGMVDVVADANESVKQDLARGPRVMIGDLHLGLGRSALTEALLADAKLRRVEAMDFGKPWNLEDLLRGLHLLPLPVRLSKFANIHAINRQRRLKQRR